MEHVRQGQMRAERRTAGGVEGRRFGKVAIGAFGE